MTPDSDIIIVGGGLNGSVLGLALAQGGLSVTLIDARPAPAPDLTAFDGRAYALALGSQRLLSVIGLWPGLGEQSQPILAIKTTDGLAVPGIPPVFLAFDHAEIEEGPMGYMVEDRHLTAALHAALAATPGLTRLTGETVTAQQPAPASIALDLASGRRMTARVLVGCDGRGSGTADRAGITRTGWDYGQTALVTGLHHSEPHTGTAHQIFLPGGPLAILPLAGGHHSAVVWTEASSLAAAIQALPDSGYLAALAPRIGRFLGDLTLAGTRFTYPLALSLANRLIAPRTALVGDAAHGVHPIAGQGLNLGLRDVGALAEVLILAARRGEDIGAADVLTRYQRWRRFDATAMALGIDAVNRLFSNDNPVLRAGRDLGMGLIARMPGLRRRFIRQAAGLTGELPRLLTGRPI